MRFITLAALILLTATLSIAQAGDHPTKAEHPKPEHPKAEHPKVANNIVAVASAAGDFKTFVSLLNVAGVTEALQDEGPYTVFAPTDEAFAKLPKGTLDDLRKPENKETLLSILACHVIPGKVMASDVKTMKVTSVSHQELDIKVEKDNVTVNEATVVKTDVVAGNGVIHAIDTVIVPDASAKNASAAKPKDHPGH